MDMQVRHRSPFPTGTYGRVHSGGTRGAGSTYETVRRAGLGLACAIIQWHVVLLGPVVV